VPDIVKAVSDFFLKDAPLKGLRALVTSGPTFEPLDPVRFLGNRSSGKQGHAIAEALAFAGAQVTLVSGPVHEPAPRFANTIRVETAQQMLEACLKSLPVDIAVCAAAVADFRPEEAAGQKIKKSGSDPMSVKLVQNPDILGTLSNSNQRPKLVVGFAAETNDGLENAKTKLARKGCDWLVLNDVGGGKVFGQDLNVVTLLKKSGADISAETWAEMTKKEAARDLVAQIAAQLRA
jgi:phosphopantothenoylcysteine decarboxylase/phosphopantothenate--cysteine ligase